MARSVIAVIVSYIAICALTFLAFTATYMVLHADGSFKPGGFESSKRWILAAFVVNFVIAVIGGWICAKIAKAGKAPIALAIVLLVIGLALAIPSMMAQKANVGLVRRGEVPMMEAMQKAHGPTWVNFTFPIVGVLGVLTGAKLGRRS
jgi:undecaprenyl pyrophosphate phosphatase UppP